MNEHHLRKLLEDVRAGNRSIDEAVDGLRHLPFEDLGFAKFDHHRSIRCGFPEVILAEGKTPEQVQKLADVASQAESNLLITRASPQTFEAVESVIPRARYHELSRAITVRHQPAANTVGTAGIISAGTGDLPAAEEAMVTLEIMDRKTSCLYDVGVAGIHRLLGNLEKLDDMDVIIVAAGMDGALPS
ncbi:MAG: AIR carboxylase family protein, partial [Phycisphaerae bacterium]